MQKTKISSNQHENLFPICIPSAKNKKNLHCQCKKYKKFALLMQTVKKLALAVQKIKKTRQIDD